MAAEPLADLDTPWLNDVRAEPRAERLAAELDRTDLVLRRGTCPPGAGAGRQGRRAPGERAAGRQLIPALYRGGRRAEVPDHCATPRRRLAETLGVEPGLPGSRTSAY